MELCPLLGGDGLGLVGADEPRYAQIAHEMLVRFDAAHTIKDRLSACVTPYLYGHPWLEKPALYYWRAMFVFQEFGVHDWSARLPSASFAFIMVALIYLHMRAIPARRAPGCGADHGGLRGDYRVFARRFDRHADGCAAVDWAARLVCVVRDRLEVLALRYLFLYRRGHAGQGAGGAVCWPSSSFAAFALLRKEWSIVQRSIWWPGIALYFAITLPWFIAVQHQNPTFFREFFLEHNLERFATNRYQHSQPFWYYLVVVVLAVMPWTVIALRALIDGMQTSVAEWRLRRLNPQETRSESAGRCVS